MFINKKTTKQTKTETLTYRRDGEKESEVRKMDRIEFDALSSKIKELETEVESLKNKTLCLLVSFVVILIFTSFSVMNIIRQYSTIHDYYMDSQRIDQEIGQSLSELIQKIEELQSKSE